MQQQLPVFVYGTLRRGYGNHSRFADAATAISVATFENASMFAGGVPFVRRTETGTVIGELVDIDPAQYEFVMKRLDQLEGFNGVNAKWNLYDRERVTVTVDGGGTREAWTYLASEDLCRGKTPVPSGDYTEYRQPSCPIVV